MTDPHKVMGIEVHVDPTMPPDRIEIRDPETGEVRAYWGEHGVFEVLPPRPWRSLGRTTGGGEVWTAPIGTPPPGRGVQIVRTEGLPEGYLPPSGALFKQKDGRA